jgi:hypothetical protein
VVAGDQDRPADHVHELVHQWHPGTLDHPVVKTGVRGDHPRMVPGGARRPSLLDGASHDLDFGAGAGHSEAERTHDAVHIGSDSRVVGFEADRILAPDFSDPIGCEQTLRRWRLP